ncbi:efflux RND transporter periplasmic adaptor subunit [Verrucomicrobia bacterium S94]|nr:efflux RND transporter periplasmic adaptor subunit [Verrucomicrobia bacterium S94]
MKLNKKLITGIGGGVLALVVIALIAASAVRRREVARHNDEVKMQHQNTARPVRCEQVKAVLQPRIRSYPGVVKATEEASLSFRVGGPLTQVNVVLGEPVKKGTLLMQIDPRDFEDRILSLEAQLEGKEASAENARQDYRRVAELFKEKVVPQADYDRAKSVMDSAEAAVKDLKAQLRIARHALQDTALLAPYDGTVTEQRVENYEMISPGQVVLHYHAIDQLEINVHVPENEVVHVPMDAKELFAYVTFPALPGREFKAGLKEWSTRADPMTRTYAATFEMKAPESGRILPGMTATVTFRESSEQSRAITLPVSAVASSADGVSVVWIYDEDTGTVRQREVQVGELNGTSRVVITDGLREGELAVVSGSRFLHEGCPVRVVNDQ